MDNPLDFPPGTEVGQKYTGSNGVVYRWDGTAWLVSFYDNPTQHFDTASDLVNQIRTILQDVDFSSEQYRYSTDSIVTNINQGFIEMYRMRPDIFLTNGFVIPQYDVGHLSNAVNIEMQYIPALIYYAVGLTQARDDEQNQDARALGFLKVFQQIIVNGGLA